MKIAVVHSFYSGRTPSGENTVVNMQVDALRELGHDVSLLSVSTDDLSKRPGYAARTARNVILGAGESPMSALEAIKPDVVHVHNLFPNYSTGWLDEWHGPLVSTVHNYRPVCAAGTLFRDGGTCLKCPTGSQINAVIHACYRGSRIASIPVALRNRRGVNADPLLSRSHSVIFLSSRSKSQYADFGFVPASSVVLPNFVEASPPAHSVSDNRWAFVGRLSMEKGIVPLLEAWPREVGLDIYGDGPLRETVQTYANDMIRCHGTFPRTSVLGLLPSKQGLVIPSVCAEQFPTVYPEALAAGIPVVARAGNSAADDILTSGVGGVFDEWDEVPSMLSRITKERATLALGARNHYRECFTKHVWTRSVIDVYKNAINRIC